MTEAPTQPEQFDEIRADRACIGCGFNLYAQPVTKEEHYGLAICRCPECGTVASLQQYPVMSHWVNRFRLLLAAVWIFLLLGIYVGNTAAITGMTQGSCYIAAESLGHILGSEHQAWEDAKTAALLAEQAQQSESASEQREPTTPTNTGTNTPGTTTITTANGVTTTIVNGTVVTTTGTTGTSSGWWTQITPEWKEAHMDDTITLHGGLWKNVDREFLIMLLPTGIVATVFGIFWSVALLGATRKKVLLLPLISCVIGFGIVFAINAADNTYENGSGIAAGLYTPIVAPMMLVYQFLVMALAIWIGRKLARLIVTMALPARGRVPLSILWTRDGLELPR